ncbi:uncharacterized protein LOC143368895 [Andrena cerasifolii]|uniref:uncharacterized protein LOC143368895 n=1 Tax=Andrena cerasifolii TaxID=2819439 RepID=UPI00403820D1
MDDVLSGAPTVEGARMLLRELAELCKAGGFRLRKSASNSQDFLRTISSNDLGTSRQWDMDTPHRVLGIQWLPEGDRFQICCLQDLSSARSLWLLKTDWDKPLSSKEDRLWNDFIGALPTLRDVRIPRWLGQTATRQSIAVHGFSDASEQAFAAVVYLRVSGDGGQRQISLITANTKVAPLKRVSLPRLELCGAHLLTRLTARTLEALDRAVDDVHLWTDSLVTLGWIQSHSSRWQTYVANRVADIQRTLPNARWHHVRSQDNPADCASRGPAPSELPSHPLWWIGPISLTRITGPAKQFHHPTRIWRSNDKLSIFRVTAWCCRWLRKRQGTRKPYLVSHELQEVQHRLVRLVQGQCFAQEVSCVQAKRPLPTKSRLLRLNPFLDDNGILRVSGRLQHSLLLFSRKHPLIMPDKTHLATFWIDETH